MTTNVEVFGRSPTTSHVGRSIVPILIRVPALRPTAKRPTRTAPGRRRRRLRKEVRFAGLTMMSVLPVGFLLIALGGAEPVPRPTRPSPPLSIVDFRRVAELSIAPLAIEPVGPTRSESIPVPVAFRGYLLPADASEAPDHAGR